MSFFRVTGGRPLAGGITPQGAKNEALQVLCATLLTSEPVAIHNIPDIRDVNRLIDLLSDLGVKTENLGGGSWRFIADNIDPDYLKTKPMRKRQLPSGDRS